MVYTGPSRACGRCRHMKKKCDQTRPQCTRCIVAKVQFCGYRDEFAHLYRDEREKAMSRTLAPKIHGPSSNTFNPQVMKRDSTDYTILPPHDSMSSTKAQDLISFFFQQFSEPAKECNWPGWIARLPEQYALAPEDPCIKPALLAASYAILAKRQDETIYQNTARAFYISALRATSQALKNHQYGDPTMLAISLLDAFQFIMEENANDHGHHVAGLKAVLAVRREEEEDIKRSAEKEAEPDISERSMFAFMPQVMGLLQELRAHEIPSESSVLWVASLNEMYGGPRLAKAFLQFGQVSARAHNLCHVVRQNIAHSQSEFNTQLANAELMSIVEITEAVDQENEGWHRNGDSKWEFSRRSNLYGIESAGTLLPFLDAYHDLWTACVWNVSRAARIILMDTIIESAELLATFNTNMAQVETLTGSALRARRKIGELLDDIRYSLPYIRGQIDSDGILVDKVDAPALNGMCVLWPLNVVHSCKSLDIAERRWARDILLEIGTQTGIRRAWALARRNIEATKVMIPLNDILVG